MSIEISQNLLHDFLKNAAYKPAKDSNGNPVIHLENPDYPFNFDSILCFERDDADQLTFNPKFAITAKIQIPEPLLKRLYEYRLNFDIETNRAIATLDFTIDHDLRSKHLRKVLPHFLQTHCPELEVVEENDSMITLLGKNEAFKTFSALFADESHVLHELDEIITRRIDSLGEADDRVVSIMDRIPTPREPL